MRILVAQLNPIVGAFAHNLGRIELVLSEARAKGAELVVFPEQAIAGCPAKEFWEDPAFREANQRSLERLAQATRSGPPVIVGCGAPAEGGGGWWNAAAVLEGGELRTVVGKAALDPRWGEERDFVRGAGSAVVVLAGARIAVHVGEAPWEEGSEGEPGWRGAQLVVNLAASPYELGLPERRLRRLRALASEAGVPVVSAQLVGANDTWIFDGGSAVIGGDGNVYAKAAAFREVLLAVDVALPEPSQLAGKRGEEAEAEAEAVWRAGDELSPAELDELRDALCLGIRDYVQKTGNSSVVLGLSGGIDSALVASLAARALAPSRVLGVLLPSRYTSAMSIEDAEALAKNLGIATRTLPIESALEALLGTLEEALGEEGAQGTTEENLQARIRGVLLMALSNQTGSLLLTTGNKSELAVGYCTLYGDMAGAIAPIGDLPKTWVYALSRHLNRERPTIPERTITRPPTAELREGQLDQDSLPPYEELDRILAALVERGLSPASLVEAGESEATVAWAYDRLLASEHKRRQAAPPLRVTRRAFGEGWRRPVAHAYSSRSSGNSSSGS